jgi:hypothetical protein
MTSTAGWLAANGIGQADYFADAGQLARARAAQQEAAEAAGDREREAAQAERSDARATAMYLAGMQPGATLARAQQMADARAEIQDHRDAIAKLERRLERFQRQAAAEAETMTRAAGMAERSAALDPVAEALQRAREAHREYVTRSRAALSGAVTGRRPFGGVVRRSDPADCPHCLALDATPEESFAIHHPELLPPLGAEPVTVPDDSERAQYGSGPEITRDGGAIIGVSR